MHWLKRIWRIYVYLYIQMYAHTRITEIPLRDITWCRKKVTEQSIEYDRICD